MKGVVFHTSVATIIANADQRWSNHARSSTPIPWTKPVVGSKANRHASAATTVMTP